MRPASSTAINTRHALTSIFVGLLCVLPGCPTPSPESPALAVINGRSITQSEFDLRWAELPETRRTHYDREGGKRQFLDDLITRELLLQEAERLGLGRSPRLRQRLEALREQMILDELTLQAVGAAADVTDGEFEAYVAAHRELLPADAEIRTARIVVDTPELAHTLKRQLEHGGDFAKLAGRFSTDKTSRIHGGDLGVFRPGTVAPEVETAILSLKVGMISDPIKTESGYHLVKIVSRESPDPRVVHAARAQLRRELIAEKRFKQYADFIAKLRGHAVIRTES